MTWPFGVFFLSTLNEKKLASFNGKSHILILFVKLLGKYWNLLFNLGHINNFKIYIMKKLVLVSMLFFAASALQAQEIKLGVHGGIPVGDISDASDFTLGVDLAYLFSPVDMFQVGPMIGYSHYFIKDMEFGGETFEFDDVSFLPIAASGRVSLGDAVFAGADLGYAVGISDGNDGGFYYRPKLGFDLLGLWVVGSYEGISMDGGSVSSVNVGVEFSF